MLTVICLCFNYYSLNYVKIKIDYYYLLCTLLGGVFKSHWLRFTPVGPVIDTGVAGLVPPLPAKQVVPKGEQARRFDLRHDLFRNRSLKQ